MAQTQRRPRLATLERLVQSGSHMSPGWSLLALINVLAQTTMMKQSPPAPPAASEPDEVAMLEGLYPQWEGTGCTQESGTGQIGYAHAQWAFGRLQLGTQPFLDLYGTVNIQAKLAVWRGEDTWVALQLGAYRIPVDAPHHAIGQLHATGFENYAPVTRLPLTLAATWRPSARARLHAATTVLVSRSPDLQHQHVTAGEGLLAELLATRHWAARVHTGVEGIGVDARPYAGLSFAYGARWLQLQAGYARTLPLQGQAGDGVVMFDGALLFR